jgi:hypothetical protein
MPSKHQFTGMWSVYLVAAELSRHGFIASPTSRSVRGADILVTNPNCTKAYSVQVKTNAVTFGFWLLNSHSKKMNSASHIYVFVNLRNDGEKVEFYVVPSKVVARNMVKKKHRNNIWYWFSRNHAEKYKDKWAIFSRK